MSQQRLVLGLSLCGAPSSKGSGRRNLRGRGQLSLLGIGEAPTRSRLRPWGGPDGCFSLQEPVLSKEQPAFQYSSHVSLQASSGHMW